MTTVQLTTSDRVTKGHQSYDRTVPIDPNQAKVETFAQRAFPGNLPRELAHNVIRDPAWATVSALNVNLLGQAVPALDSTASLHSQITSSSFIQPMAAQWVFATAPMLLLAAGETVSRKAKGEELTPQELAKIWAPPVAASLAIPMWDLGLAIGTHIGSSAASLQNSSLWYGSSIAAGMVAAPFTGIFEGFTQWGVKYAADVATNPVTRQMWREDPALMGKLLTKELVLNVTIGAIPGAVWQIVYFFLLPVLLIALGPVGGIIAAALLVGIAVMLCNFGCTHVINRVSSAVDRAFGWDKEFQELKAQAEEAIAQSQKAANPVATDLLSQAG